MGSFESVAQNFYVIDSLKKELTKFQSVNNKLEMYYIYNDLAYHYTKFNVDSALIFNKKSLEIAFSDPKWKNFQNSSLMYSAFLNMKKGFSLKAIENYYKVLNNAELQKDTVIIVTSLRLLGETYFTLNEYKKALEFSSKSFDLAEKSKNKREQIASLLVEGTALKGLSHFNNAEKSYRKSLNIAKQINDNHTLAVCMHNLAIVLKKQNKSKEALALFNQSFSIHLANKDDYSIGNLAVDLANFYFDDKAYNLSLKYSKIGLEYGRKSRSLEVVSKAYQILSKNYYVINQPDDALKYYQMHIQLKDSLQKEDFNKRINNLSLEYENSKKNIEIEKQKVDILSKTNENLLLQRSRNYFIFGILAMVAIVSFLYFKRMQLRKQNILLEEKVQERTAELGDAYTDLMKKNKEIKEALFKGQSIERKRVAGELHDNLSSLLSALKMSLQALKIEKFNPNEQKIMVNIKEMMNSAYSEVRNISHNILPEDLDKKGLIFAIEKLFEKINLSNQTQFMLTQNIDNERIDSRFEFNIYSIILEIANNVIKHANANTAIFKIQKTENSLNLTFSDDGIGFDPNTIKKGVGLRNIQSRVDAMNGDIQFLKGSNDESIIEIIIPI